MHLTRARAAKSHRDVVAHQCVGRPATDGHRASVTLGALGALGARAETDVSRWEEPG